MLACAIFFERTTIIKILCEKINFLEISSAYIPISLSTRRDNISVINGM